MILASVQYFRTVGTVIGADVVDDPRKVKIWFFHFDGYDSFVYASVVVHILLIFHMGLFCLRLGIEMSVKHWHSL